MTTGSMTTGPVATGSVTSGNGVPTVTHDGEGLHARDGGKQLRDIEELVAKLRVVTKQLALFPPRPPFASRRAEGFPPAQLASHEEPG